MAKVKYLDGDTSQYGYAFEGGKPVEVTDAKHLAKFAGNRFFEVSGAATAGLKAEHHGGGKFNITNGETVVSTGLSKADADAFNAMTADEKLAYVSGASK